MHTPSAERPDRRCLPVLLVTGLFAVTALLAPGAAWARQGDDPNLDQSIDADQPIVRGTRVIETGHVDMGPKFDSGRWRFLIHDDAHKADANAVNAWRYPDETVLRVVDAAKLTVPDNQTYSFVGAGPGATVWVIPQTQNPDVVWAGWNTQDPTVMQRIDRGATFSVTGVQGPGVLTVYLQSGDFGAPQVLWDSRKSGPQQVWVDTNTHAHANWVFTQPGVYLVQMQASATLVGGARVSDTQVLRFAVGTGVSTDDALGATWKGAPPVAAASTAAASTPASPSTGVAAPVATTPTAGATPGPLVPILIAAVAVVAVAVVVGFGVAAVRGNRTRRHVLAARASGGGNDGQQVDGDVQ